MLREVLESSWMRGALAFIVASSTNLVWVTTASAKASPEQATNLGTAVKAWIPEAAIVAALLTGGISLLIFFRQQKEDRNKREQDRQQREEALLKALHAEITPIRSNLWEHTAGVKAALENPDNVGLRMTELFISTDVYRASIGSLGQISDGELVGEITSIYADLDILVQQAKYIPAFVREHDDLELDRVQSLIRDHNKIVVATLPRAMRLEYILGGITNALAQQRPITAVSSSAKQLRNDWSNDAAQLSPELRSQLVTAFEAWARLWRPDVDAKRKELDAIRASINVVEKRAERRTEEVSASIEMRASRLPTSEELELAQKLFERLEGKVAAEQKEENASKEKPSPS
jgi:hypothetical protein